jgi:GrpB-like predicted nucleotidyltransferase (UPF0157 family)
MTSASAVELRPVDEVAAAANAIVEQFERDSGLKAEHIGATSFGAGTTKGDVDVNVRVDADRFDAVVEALSRRYPVAQADNWTDGFASFSSTEYDLPLGIQVTAIGGESDFLLYLRDRLAGDPELRGRYDALKAEAAPHGAEAYWRAKDAFLRDLLAERPR